MIKILNIKWFDDKLIVKKLTNLFEEELNKLNIRYLINYDYNQAYIEFREAESKGVYSRLFISKKKNVKKLSKDSALRKSKNIDSLPSDRLTEKQFDKVKDIIMDTLDKLCVSADVQYESKKGIIDFRKDNKFITWLPKPKSFPVEAE